MNIPTTEEARDAKKTLLAKSEPLKKKLADLQKKLAPLQKEIKDAKLAIHAIEVPDLGMLNSLLVNVERKEAREKARASRAA